MVFRTKLVIEDFKKNLFATLKHSYQEIVHAQFLLWAVPAWNHGSCARQLELDIFLLMKTATEIPADPFRRVSQREFAIELGSFSRYNLT